MDKNFQSKKRKLDEPGGYTATRATLLEIPEILAIVLKSLDTERLKRYRTVCLTWCNEVSRIFRARVVPRYSHSDWTKFQDLLDKGKEQPRMICPFQEIYARICAEEDLNPNHPSFDWLLHPAFPITRLTLLTSLTPEQRVSNQPSSIEEVLTNAAAGRVPPFPPTYDPELQKRVWDLLQSCSSTLTHLATPFWNSKKEQISELGLSSLHFPQLRALKAVWRKYFQYPHNIGEEIEFFRRIIVSAPMLKELELDGIFSASFLLGRVGFSLKGLEKLVVRPSEDYLLTWSVLSKVDAEALKFIHTTEKYRGPENTIFNRFSSSLEHFGIHRGPYKIPGCPFLTHLEVDANEAPVDLKSFPSLMRVTLHGARLNPGIKHSSRTVTEVDIDNFFVRHPAVRISVLGKLLKLFPCATHWKINYQTLEDFCQVFSKVKFPVERLAVTLRCFGEAPCIRSSADSRLTTEADLKVFAALHLLQNLRDLELYQSPGAHTCGVAEATMKLSYNISKIPYGGLPKLQNLRIYAKSHELPHDLIQLQNLDIAAEVTVDPCPTSPNWSDPVVFMGNVTLRVAETEFP